LMSHDSLLRLICGAVYIRIRPTASFAHELIECLPDHEVTNAILRSRKDSKKGKRNNQLSSWVFQLNGVLYVDNFSFGQTGAGKTYTMTALQEVFQEVERHTDHTFSVHLSFLEIYNETMVDLLSSLKQGNSLNSGVLTVGDEQHQIHTVSNEILSETQVEEVRSQVQRHLSGLLDEIPVNTIVYTSIITQIQCAVAKSSHRHQRAVSPKPSKARKKQTDQQVTISFHNAFKDFKAERGSEINRILKENKAVLLERMAQLRTLTDAINAVGFTGQFVSAEGEPVLEEAELSLMIQLKELKNRYRQAYEDFRSTKTEVSCCQHLVNQCRTRLLTEFESWYNESLLFCFKGLVRPGHIPVDKALTLVQCDVTYSVFCLQRGRRQVSRSPESVRGSRSETKLAPILSVV
uniref:Kinesin motor domain-containing protein n=1 Tax=Cyprinus carpio TaxID=7962 RepID=A0A8C2HTD1_CYPCA